MEARWPQGKIGGVVPAAGREHGLLQVQGAEVDPGLSGAPVLDLTTGRVVGMVTGYQEPARPSSAPKVRFAYATPAEALYDLWPKALKLHPPEPEQEAVLREALTTVREIRDADGQARMLVGLVPHLPEGLLHEALAAARELPETRRHRSPRTLALAGLAPRLAELGHPREALAVVREIGQEEYWQTQALAGLAPHLPDGLLREALAAAREIEQEGWRAQVLVALAPCLTEGLLYEALAVAREIRGADDRAKVLTELAPSLAAWAGKDAVAAHAAWRETLPILARHTRQSLLSDLRALLPTLPALGGAQAVVETFRAIQDVRRW